MLYLIPPQNFLSFNTFPSLPSAGIHRSSYSIAENDEESKLQVDFPGAEPQDVSVTFDNGALTITNEAQDFSRSFAVDTSNIEIDKVEAFLNDGVLTVVAPKLPEPEPLEIPVLVEPVVEGENSSRLNVDLPGVKADNVSVSLDSCYIVVKASRKVGADTRGLRKTFHVNKAEHDLSQVKAYLHHGVLTVSIPIKPKPVPLEVPIQTEEVPTPVGDDLFQFAMDMPGVKAADASVKVDDDVLRMTATRTYGNGKTVQLGKAATLDQRVKRDLLQATLVDGVLSVSAPRDPLPAPRTIPVVRKPAEDNMIE